MTTLTRLLASPFLAALTILALAVPGTFAPLAAQEQSNSIEVGDFVVHYNAIPTTLLTPEVARHYGITRSSGRALLNISVLRKGEDGATGTPARVTAAATNLNGQRQDLAVREVREAEAIYYLAEARFQDREVLTFELEVAPEASEEVIRARFQQQFFAQ